MSYVHEDQDRGENSASLNHQEDSEEYPDPEDQEDFQETRRSASVTCDSGLVPERGGQQLRTSSVVRSTEKALLQRRADKLKLQMATMIGNGDLPSSSSSMNFYRVQLPDHNNSQADDSRLDRQNEAMNVAPNRRRSHNFTLKETFDLLKIWSSPEMQWQMKHNFRNFRVWEAISYSMNEMGHDRTTIQCRNRIQNLTSIFYRIKKSNQDYRTFHFPYYKLIGEVLDKKKELTTAMADPIELSPALAKFATNYKSDGNGNGIMNNSQSNNSFNNPGRMTAHTSPMEGYHHLINANPGTNNVDITSFTERNSSSSNGSSNMNILSPEVSLYEGNSPIRVEAQGPWSATKPMANGDGVPAMSFSNRYGGNSTTSAGGSLELEQGDSVTITMEEGPLPSEEHEQDVEALDYDDADVAGDELSSGSNGGLQPRAIKRSFPSSFINPCYGKSVYGPGIGMHIGNAAKRPRVRVASTATATNASSAMDDDPIGQYLAEMVDIERQWLEMERVRAENDRAMMTYMMQTLQTIVCPNQPQFEDADGEEEYEFAGTEEQEAEDNEIRQMIELEEKENQPPNVEPVNDE